MKLEVTDDQAGPLVRGRAGCTICGFDSRPALCIRCVLHWDLARWRLLLPSGGVASTMEVRHEVDSMGWERFL